MAQTNTPRSQPTNSIVVADSADLGALRSKAGFFGRLGASASVSVAARQELRNVETERVRMQGSIARTALAAAGVQIKSALVTNEAPKIGALLVALNARVDAVSQSLTNGSQAAVTSHLRNRTENAAISRDLQQQGTISDEEAAALQNFANTDAAADIERSRAGMAEAKKAIEHFRGLALQQLLSATVDSD